MTRPPASAAQATAAAASTWLAMARPTRRFVTASAASTAVDAAASATPAGDESHVDEARRPLFVAGREPLVPGGVMEVDDQGGRGGGVEDAGQPEGHQHQAAVGDPQGDAGRTGDDRPGDRLNGARRPARGSGGAADSNSTSRRDTDLSLESRADQTSRRTIARMLAPGGRLELPTKRLTGARSAD